MEWEEFSEKYKSVKDEFNAQGYDERCRTSRLTAYDAIAELIRSKKHLRDAIAKTDERIKQLINQIEGR